MIRIRMGPRRNRSVAAAVVAGLACCGLAATAIFIVVSGGRLTGGLPLLPDAWNQAFGRALFAVGALCTAGMGVYAFHDAWRLLRERARRVDQARARDPG
ncbi:hypothetical protein [Pseudoxanthomonas koreensis]|uniref:hypothetical protein n=1 Tax=Pseudoxanthomonas koreensis TaxID=266061 RepID=UPI0035A74562